MFGVQFLYVTSIIHVTNIRLKNRYIVFAIINISYAFTIYRMAFYHIFVHKIDMPCTCCRIFVNLPGCRNRLIWMHFLPYIGRYSYQGCTWPKMPQNRLYGSSGTYIRVQAYKGLYGAICACAITGIIQCAIPNGTSGSSTVTVTLSRDARYYTSCSTMWPVWVLCKVIYLSRCSSRH